MPEIFVRIVKSKALPDWHRQAPKELHDFQQSTFPTGWRGNSGACPVRDRLRPVPTFARFIIFVRRFISRPTDASWKLTSRLVRIRSRDLLWDILRFPYYVIMSQFKSTEKRIFTTHKHFAFAQQISSKRQSHSVWWKSGLYMMEKHPPQPQNTLREFSGEVRREAECERSKALPHAEKGINMSLHLHTSSISMEASAACESAGDKPQWYIIRNRQTMGGWRDTKRILNCDKEKLFALSSVVFPVITRQIEGRGRSDKSCNASLDDYVMAISRFNAINLA